MTYFQGSTTLATYFGKIVLHVAVSQVNSERNGKSAKMKGAVFAERQNLHFVPRRLLLFPLNLKIMLQMTEMIALFARKYKNYPSDIKCFDLTILSKNIEEI